ncbi:MAG: hypothetical protein AAF999_13300 [Pseudomonadota bacterium]
MLRTTLITTTALALSGFAAHATTVPADLSTWTENGNPNNNAGTWTVQSGGDSVLQSRNGTPTVFFEKGKNAQGTALRGTISVNSRANDDDFIGFVLGYQDGEINSTNADFWLFD